MDRESALTAPWTDSAVLLGFVDELREAGYNVATEQYVAVQDLVLALAARGEDIESPESLRGLLGPILCSSPAEQQDFRGRFDDWLARFSGEDEAAVEEPGELDQLLAALHRAFLWWRWGLAVLLIVVASGLFYTWSLIQEKELPTLPPAGPAPAAPSDGTFTGGDEEELVPVQPEDVQAEVVAQPEQGPQRESATRHESPWWRMLAPVLAILLVPLAWSLAWQEWWRYRAQLFLKRHAVSERPKVERVAVRSLLDELLPSLSLLRTARDFRRRHFVESRHLDVAATVDATARHGGWPTLVGGRRQVLPEYLVLVDRASFRDQHAELFENLIDRLAGHDVLITRYHFDSDPRICFPAGKGTPAGLRQLVSTHQHHRFLIFSDATGFLDPGTGELEPWADELLRFEDQTLLTPGPPALLGRRATVLRPKLMVLPATVSALTAWIRSLHGASIREPSADGASPLPMELAERSQRWLARDAPEARKVESVLEDLETYLSPAGFYWLCACAVYPALHLSLTVHLGNVLCDSDGERLLEFRRLTTLTRLPWFRYGSMPDWLRVRLISRLSRSEERSVRGALEALLLSALRAPSDFELEIAGDSGRPVARLTQAILRILSKRQPDDGPLRDHVFLSFMSGRRLGPLSLRVPEAVRDRLTATLAPIRPQALHVLSVLRAYLLKVTSQNHPAFSLQNLFRVSVLALLIIAIVLMLAIFPAQKNVVAEGEVAIRVTPATYIHNLAEVSGQLWVAAGDGIYRLDGPSARMTLQGLSATTIANVRGELWAGTESGIYRYRENAWELFIDDLYVSAILDAGETIWIGARQGLFRIESDAADALQLDRDALSEPFRDLGVIFQIKEVKEVIWVATSSNAYRISGSGMIPIFGEATRRSVVDIVDASGDIWLITQTNSAYSECFHVVGDGQLQIVSKYGVTSVAEVRGETWLGTTEGVFRLREDGLLEGPVGGIGEAVNTVAELGKYIWIGTQRRMYRSLDGRTFAPFPELATFNAKGVEFAEDHIWILTAAGLFRLDQDVGIAVELAGIPWLVIGRSIAIKTIRYDHAGEDPYGGAIVPYFRAILQTDQESFSRALRQGAYHTYQGLSVEVKSFGIEKVYIKSLDAFGNTVTYSPRYVVVIPEFLVLTMNLWLLVVFLFMVAPFSDLAMVLLMMPLFRKYGSGFLIPFLLFFSRGCRKYLLSRYLFGVIRDDSLVGGKSFKNEIDLDLAEGKRFLIVGSDSGSVESFLRRLTWRIAAGKLPAFQGYVPIFLALRRFAMSKGDLVREAAGRLEKMGGITDLGLGEGLLRRGGFVFLLDGLDMLTDERRVIVENFIAESPSDTIIIVGSSQNAAELSDFKTMLLEPADDHADFDLGEVADLDGDQPEDI